MKLKYPVDDIEIRYITGLYSTTDEPGYNPRRLFKEAVTAIPTAWKMKYGHTGLSVFTLAYLAKYPGGHRALANDLNKKKIPNLKLIFCAGTNLPVVAVNCVQNYRRNWNGDVALASPTRIYSIGSSPSGRKFAYDRYKVICNTQIVDGLTDEEMRTFGKFPIRKEIWHHLKSIADIYNNDKPDLNWDGDKHRWVATKE